MEIVKIIYEEYGTGTNGHIFYELPANELSEHERAGLGELVGRTDLLSIEEQHMGPAVAKHEVSIMLETAGTDMHHVIFNDVRLPGEYQELAQAIKTMWANHHPPRRPAGSYRFS